MARRFIGVNFETCPASPSRALRNCLQFFDIYQIFL